MKNSNFKLLKDVLKKTFLYPYYLEGFKLYVKINRRQEIEYRLRNDQLLKGLTPHELQYWNERTEIVLASADNKKINSVPSAGRLKRGLLVMHNGILIDPLSYYGYPVFNMLVKNRGIHEPQEEYAFQEVLKEIPAGATMIELGAYWSFYSMWFCKKIKNAKNYMIEPCNLEPGIRNFKMNKLKGKFFKYSITNTCGFDENGLETISIDTFVASNNIQFVDLLHSDIQGNELLMLYGASNLLKNKKIGYIFISTHSDKLHSDCIEYLEYMGYSKVCSADLKQTYSYDGLLVYKNPEYKGTDKLEISLRQPEA